MQITVEYYPFGSDILAWSETLLCETIKECLDKKTLKKEDYQRYWYRLRNERGEYYNFNAEQWVAEVKK